MCPGEEVLGRACAGWTAACGVGATPRASGSDTDPDVTSASGGWSVRDGAEAARDGAPGPDVRVRPGEVPHQAAHGADDLHADLQQGEPQAPGLGAGQQVQGRAPASVRAGTLHGEYDT